MRTYKPAGFALPAVLAVTGMVTLIFLVAITALTNLTTEARSAQARVRFIQAALTAEARIAYLAATEPLGSDSIAVGRPRATGEYDIGLPVGEFAAGLPVRIDGSPYRTDGEAPLILSVQDEAGMINLAGLDDQQTVRLAAQLGLPDSTQRRVRQIYLDYIDADTLVRQGGIEQSVTGGSRVANRPMLRPAEWLSLSGIRSESSPERWRVLEPFLAVDRAVFLININTASAAVLTVLFDISDEQAAAAIRARQTAPFLSLEDFNAAAGSAVVDDGEHRYVFPSGRFFYTIQDTRSAWVYRGRLSLTPGGSERPFWIDQTELKEAKPSAAIQAKDATPFPHPIDVSPQR